MRQVHFGWVTRTAATAVLMGATACGDSTNLMQPPTQTLYTTPTGLLTVNPPQIFIGAGDISSCGNNGDEATAQILDTIAGTVYVLGDNVYENGTNSEYSNCYHPTWGRHKARTKPSAGNHDYNTSGASGYYNYFGAAAGDPSKGYYSYDLGSWHIIVLNSNISMGAGSAQETWLRGVLDAHPNQCKAAYFHHPLWSSTGGSGSGGTYYSGVRALHNTMYAGGVDLILTGHRHFYERLERMKPDGSADPVNGFTSIIVGSGGIGGGSLSNEHPRHVTGNGDTRGVLKLYLYDDSFAWRFIPQAGRTYTDTGSVACLNASGGGSGGGVSASLSTLNAAPTSIAASSGGTTSLITVTARDANGDPMSGASVVLSATGSGNTIGQPSGTTNGNGVATGSLSSTAAGTKTVSAAINGVTITQTATVTVTAGPPSAGQSTVSASPSFIQEGSGTSTITVTAKDAFGNLVSGAAVTLAASGSGNTLTQPASPTNASGVATGTLSSTVAGTKTVSATAGGVAITQTATVQVTSQPPPGGGTITHTLLTAGNSPANGRVHTTTSISPAPNALITVAILGHRSSSANPDPTLTGGGMASWDVVSSVTFDPVGSGRKRLTVYRAMSPAPGSGPITITFNSSVSNTQWIVSQWQGVETGGVNGADAIGQTGVTAADAASGLGIDLGVFGTASNVAYGAFGVASGSAVITPGAGFTEISEQPSGETPADLMAEWAVGDPTVDASWASLNGGGVAVEIRAAGGGGPVVSASQSTVSASPTTIAASNGATTSTITVTARDAGGNPINGATVQLAASGTGNTITQPAATNANGVATGTVSSTAAGLKTISATANGVAITQTASVTVTSGAPAALAFIVQPSNTTAGGTITPAVQVEIRDQFGNRATGATNAVTLAIGTNPGGGTLSGTTIVAAVAGVATFSNLSINNVGTGYTLTAAATGLSGATSSGFNVTGVPPSPSLSTVAVSPSSITAGGSGTTITVTARDAGGNPINGATVVLAATGTGNTLTQPAGPTGANGVATGTLASTVAGTKTVSATIDGVAITQTQAISVTAGAPSAGASTVNASPTSITVGTGSSTITVTVKDAFGNAVSGATVTLAASGSGNTLSQPAGTTDAGGVATGTLSSTVEETKTVSAEVGGTPITQTASVTVTPVATGQITHTLLTAGNHTTNQSTYATASISPAPNALVTIAVMGHRSYGASAEPTVTGGGMAAWEPIASVTYDVLGTPLKRVTVFRAMSAAPGSGPITISFAGSQSNAQWIVSQWEGAETSGANGSGAIAQALTDAADAVNGLGVTLAPFSNPANVAFGVFGVTSSTPAVTAGSGLTEIAEVSSGENQAGSLMTEWAVNHPTIDALWSNLRAAVLGIEIRAKTGP